MILLFYCFDYVVGRKKQIDGLIVDEKNGEEEELEPKVLIYCASHI